MNDRPACGATHRDGWVCTLEPAHTRPHEAWACGELMACWQMGRYVLAPTGDVVRVVADPDGDVLIEHPTRKSTITSTPREPYFNPELFKRNWDAYNGYTWLGIDRSIYPRLPVIGLSGWEQGPENGLYRIGEDRALLALPKHARRQYGVTSVRSWFRKMRAADFERETHWSFSSGRDVLPVIAVHLRGVTPPWTLFDTQSVVDHETYWVYRTGLAGAPSWWLKALEREDELRHLVSSAAWRATYPSLASLVATSPQPTPGCYCDECLRRRAWLPQEVK